MKKGVLEMSYVIFNDHLLYFELIMQVKLEAQPTSLTLLDILFEYTPAFYNFLEKFLMHLFVNFLL